MTFQDELRQQLDPALVTRLGTFVGLNRDQAVAVADEALPTQLDRLTRQASTVPGAQRLLDVARDHMLGGTAEELAGTDERLTHLRRAGTGLLPEVMGAELEGEVQRVATQSGVPEVSVRPLMALLLPLLVGLLAGRARGRGLDAATLPTLFGSTAVIGAGALITDTVRTVPPTVVTASATPMKGPPVLISERAVPAARQDERRKRAGAWWLAPLLLLVGVGGCYVLQRRPAAAVTLIQPAEAAQIRGPVVLSGTGTAGATVTVAENGAQVATTRVAEDGTFQVAVETPAVGPHTYSVAQSGTDASVSRMVTVRAPAGGEAPASGLAFTVPAADSSVSASGLTLRGTGPSNADLTLTEDGVSLGQARTDASGAWSFDVPAPAAGAHTYRVTAGSDVSTLNLTVNAAAQTGVCAEPFTLSLKDGQRVQQPFRFGGQGSGKEYVVTVSRGARQVGQKTLPLSATCGWSYTSRPGPGRVTYTLRQSGRTAVVGTVTLTVTR